MELQLGDDEVQALRELLERELGELSQEISSTDNPSFSRGLKERRETLQSLLGKVGGGGPA